MNVAQRYIKYYDSKDFESNYIFYLLENLHNDKDVIIENIQSFVNDSYNLGRLYQDIKFNYCDRNLAEKIYDLFDKKLQEIDIDDVIKRFANYYVGEDCLISISFGEEEIDLTGIYNYKSHSTYNIRYLKRIFDKEYFYISGNYAYYNITDEGIYISMLDLSQHKDIKKQFENLIIKRS